MLSVVIMMLVWACQHQECWELAPKLVSAQLSALALPSINTWKRNSSELKTLPNFPTVDQAPVKSVSRA